MSGIFSVRLFKELVVMSGISEEGRLLELAVMSRLRGGVLLELAGVSKAVRLHHV